MEKSNSKKPTIWTKNSITDSTKNPNFYVDSQNIINESTFLIKPFSIDDINLLFLQKNIALNEQIFKLRQQKVQADNKIQSLQITLRNHQLSNSNIQRFNIIDNYGHANNKDVKYYGQYQQNKCQGSSKLKTTKKLSLVNREIVYEKQQQFTANKLNNQIRNKRVTQLQQKLRQSEHQNLNLKQIIYKQRLKYEQSKMDINENNLTQDMKFFLKHTKLIQARYHQTFMQKINLFQSKMQSLQFQLKQLFKHICIKSPKFQHILNPNIKTIFQYSPTYNHLINQQNFGSKTEQNTNENYLDSENSIRINTQQGKKQFDKCSVGSQIVKQNIKKKRGISILVQYQSGKNKNKEELIIQTNSRQAEPINIEIIEKQRQKYKIEINKLKLDYQEQKKLIQKTLSDVIQNLKQENNNLKIKLQKINKNKILIQKQLLKFSEHAHDPQSNYANKLIIQQLSKQNIKLKTEYKILDKEFHQIKLKNSRKKIQQFISPHEFNLIRIRCHELQTMIQQKEKATEILIDSFNQKIKINQKYNQEMQDQLNNYKQQNKKLNYQLAQLNKQRSVRQFHKMKQSIRKQDWLRTNMIEQLNDCKKQKHTNTQKINNKCKQLEKYNIENTNINE